MTTTTTYPPAIAFAGATGGAGTTTAAVAVATFASAGQAVRIVQPRPVSADVGDFVGFPASTAAVLRDGERADEPEANATLDVWDLGDLADDWLLDVDAPLWLCLRGPSYMALRRALAGPKVDGLVVLVEPERSLGYHDVVDVLGPKPMVVVPYSPTVARVTDAGLLVRKLREDDHPARRALDGLASIGSDVSAPRFGASLAVVG